GGVRCVECGATALLRFGVIDFLHAQDDLDGAKGARFDLRRDEAAASSMAGRDDLLTNDLTLLSEERAGMTTDRLPCCARGGRVRYKRWFASIQPELGPAPGLGIISKAEAANTGGDVGIGGEWGL